MSSLLDGGDELDEVPGVAGGKRQLTEAELEQRRQAAHSPRRGPGRPKGSKNKPRPAAADASLEARLREPLVKVAEWLSDRNPDLSRVLREDAGKIAALLAKVAAADRTPAIFVSAVGVVASMLEPFDAFGRVLRVLYVQWRDRRQARRESVPPPLDGTEQPAGQTNGEPLPLEVVPDTPDRFRYDSDPPAVN